MEEGQQIQHFGG